MIEFLLNSLWAWIGTTVLIVAACVAVGYLFPTLRLHAAAVAGLVITATTLFTRGYRAHAKKEKKRQEETAKRVQEKFNEINNRPDTVDDVAKRMRDGSF